MSKSSAVSGTWLTRSCFAVVSLAFATLAMWPGAARAIPLFNRQTGQNCVACHAGGQFPELTTYGRLFKLTGYTIGERTLPLSVMAVATRSSVSDTAKSDDPAADFQSNHKIILPTASLFVGGKVSDNVGAFAQFTYDRYASQSASGRFHGHGDADNIDIRYADRFIDEQRDLIVGVSANNNPSLADPWNTAAAWMQYVPVPSTTSSQFVDGSAPYPGYASGGNLAGITAYAYWNQSLYAELGGYRTSTGLFRFMSAGVAADETTKLKGINPYWRLAFNRDWGAHSLMVGTSGMVARVYDDPADTSDPTTVGHYRDLGVDAQYQYLLDPHAVTVQFAYMRSRARYSEATVAGLAAPNFVDAQGNPVAAPGTSDTTNTLRLKGTYVYRARYGGSLGFFNKSGNTNTANQTAGIDPLSGNVTTVLGVSRVNASLSGNPGTRGFTYEAFWTPVQNIRLGAQYTVYSRFNGASSNYDGLGRNARDNNSLFLYLWAAY
jgi:hypothetical protein